jgi:hypothetical protein
MMPTSLSCPAMVAQDPAAGLMAVLLTKFSGLAVYLS